MTRLPPAESSIYVRRRPVPWVAGWLGMALGILGAGRAEGALGTITSLAVAGNRLEIVCGTDQLELQVCASNVLRLDYKPGGSGDARTATIGTTNWPYAGATIDTNADPIVVTTPAMRVEIARSPCRVTVADADGAPVVWEPAAEGIFADGIRLAHAAGTDFYGVNGYNAWDDSTAGMLRSAGGWAEAGYQGDCGAPLIWNRNGFGLLVDSDGIQFDASATNLVAQYCSRTEVEAYLLIGGPEAVLAAAAEVSGRPPMFPKWGMGFANTEWGITQSELTNVVAGYRSRNIPLDLYVLDFDWKDWGADHYGEWVWDATKFPGGPSGALKSQMDAQGVRIGGIMKPRIHVYTEQGGYATSNGFWWPGQAEYSDYFSGQPVKDVNFSNAACRTWYFDHITNAFDTGMVAWWNDEADQAGGGSMLFGNGQFPNMQKALYEGQRGHADRRVWSINRNFWLGAQRYAYAMWSGDIDGGFASMANQRERMLSAVGVGAARWGMDIGGFNNADQTTAECYARWMQFGAVVPIFRVHGQQDQQRQPWVYGAQAEAVATAAIRLRYRLIPYVYSYDRRLHETGVGIVRPLALAFPEDPATANVKDAWMFGDSLLAAPVVAQGQTQKSIYLPAGTWRDFARGTEYAGGQTLAYAVDSSTWADLPLFVRDGAILPMQPVQNYVGEAPVTNVDLLMLPTTDTTAFTYYDDDGETYGYETGAYYRQTIALADAGDVIQADFSAPEGTFDPDVEFFYAYVRCATNDGASLNGSELARAANEAALRASPTTGWAHATNQFGYAALVKIPAGSAQALVLSNNLAATPQFSPPAGTYSGLVLVEISCATAGAEIRYTLDGTDPDGSAALYGAAIPLAATAEIRARAYVAGKDPSSIAAATYAIDANLLNNAGFETQAGTNAEAALYWEAGLPDAHGSRWGTAARVAWRPMAGAWHGAIRGTWSPSGGTSGGFRQEAEALPGQEYSFRVWCWADSTWSAAAQGLKLEFLDGAAGGESVLLAVTNSTSGVGESWVEKTVAATAPANATWVRATIYADGVGADGALQFDECSLVGPEQHVFSVVSSHGTPAPAAGYHVVPSGMVLTNSVEAAVSNGLLEYVCAGWTLAGNEPAGGATNVFTATLTNDAQLTWLWTTNSLEPSAIEFVAASNAADEAAGGVWIALQRDTTNAAASVRVTAAAGTATAGEDFAALSAIVEFAAGVETAAVELILLDDVLDEADETLALELSEPGGAGVLGAQSNAVFTILDDDDPMPDRALAVASAQGACAPPAGTNVYAHGTLVSCIATSPVAVGPTQFVCTGWTGTGSVPASGSGAAVPAFALTNDSALAWQWGTNVWLDVAAEAGGSVAGAVSGWQEWDAEVSLTATPDAGHAFAGWAGDVPPAQVMENPLALALDRARAVTGRFLSVSSGNLLNNPGFEEAAGTNGNGAAYWETGVPDAHGERWGSAARVAWRPTEGAWHGALCGTWSNVYDYGGFWQEGPAIPGRDYAFGAWFWADATWWATDQGIKVEFFDGAAGGSNVLLAATNAFYDVGETWAFKEVAATAPANATWVRVVVYANGIGANGALQFDDLSLAGPDQHVFAVASAHGEPVPARGAHAIDDGAVLTNSVPSPVSDGPVQYVCTGWTLAGLEPATGSSNVFAVAVTNDAQLTWQWETNSLYPCTIALGAAAYAAGEAAGLVLVAVVRDDATGAASVELLAAAGTAAAGADFAAGPFAVQFAVGVASQDVQIAIVDDLLHETNETVLLALVNPSSAASLGAPSNAVLTIVDDDADLGTRNLDVVSAQAWCEPAPGMQAYPYGTPLACAASATVAQAGTQLVCTGWAGTGSVPASGATSAVPAFALTADSTLAWQWATNVNVECAAPDHGHVVGLTNGWHPLGATLTLAATASSNYHFAGWSGDVPAAQQLDNPLVLTADCARAIAAEFGVDAGVNLLHNFSFEDAGASSGVAAYWATNDPDVHGAWWGSLLRANWDSHDGVWVQALRGTWATAGDAGGCWQELPALPGERYRFAAWFWADDGNPYGPWDSASRGLKIEFYSGAGGGETLLSAATNELAVVDQTWRNQSVEAVAPSNATWVRAVVLAEGVSADGSLRFDDLTLELMSVLDPPAIAPATDEAQTSFTANWQASAEATGYLLDVATDADFTPDTFAADLFLSEYAEGAGSNRYVEIYNGTGADVDLSAYRLCLIENGGSWSERTMALAGTLAHGATFVVSAPGATNAAILAATDLVAPAGGPLGFSGDDAVGLARVSGTFTNVIDAVGEEGADPGTGWDVAGTVDATYNHTLVRLASVRSGNPDWSTCADEWTVLARDDFSGIGAHAMAGGLPGAFVAGFQDRSCAGLSQAVTGLAENATYYYRVRATNETGLSDYSDVAAAQTRTTFLVLALAGPHGAIAPSGAVAVVSGNSQDFQILADAFFRIASVRIDGAETTVTNESAMTATWGPAVATGVVEAVFAEALAVHDVPHWWLDSFYPGDTNFDALAVADDDDDGSSAWEEFVADTDPTDAGDYFRIATAPAVPPAIAFFTSSTGRLYSLEASYDLLVGAWSNVPGAGPRLGLGGTDNLADTNDPPIGWYYQIRVQVP
ncbi:MAG: TIM-barrel domain-containing protein [Kiritimatiellia bacterium]